MTEPIFDSFPLRPLKEGTDGEQGVKTPTVHIGRGYERHIPLLACGRPIVCISDWQCEVPTQRRLWVQALEIFKQQVGEKMMQRALVLVAGDMASKDNNLRGTKSDAVPDYSWIRECFPLGDVLIVYGNHDDMSEDHLKMINDNSGLPCLLPQGGRVGVPGESTSYNLIRDELEIDGILHKEATTTTTTTSSNQNMSAKQAVPDYVQAMTKEQRKEYYAKQTFAKKEKPSKKERAQTQWDKANPQQVKLAKSFRQLQTVVEGRAVEQEKASPPLFWVGGVHGIPASHTQALKKIDRQDYFFAMDQVCEPKTSPIDILVTHYQPCLPGLEDLVHGEDPQMVLDSFLQSTAVLHVCGHKHLDPPIAVVAEGKVVVNADCRVVVLVPPPSSEAAIGCNE